MNIYFDIAGNQIDGDRDYQEDAYLTTYLEDDGDVPRSTALVVVADGMGGHAAGNIASNLVASNFNKSFGISHGLADAPTVLRDCLVKANHAIKESIEKTPGLEGMGCTVVTAFVAKGKLWWISVGDSHLYLVRDRKLIKKNEDHSYGGYLDRMKVLGVDINPEPGLARHMLVSAMTGDDIVEIDCPTEPLQLLPGDRVILATDGLNSLSPGALVQFSAWSPTARECAAALLKAVEDADRPRQDNTTVVVIDVLDRAAQRAKPAPVEPKADTEDDLEATQSLRLEDIKAEGEPPPPAEAPPPQAPLSLDDEPAPASPAVAEAPPKPVEAPPAPRSAPPPSPARAPVRPPPRPAAMPKTAATRPRSRGALWTGLGLLAFLGVGAGLYVTQGDAIQAMLFGPPPSNVETGTAPVVAATPASTVAELESKTPKPAPALKLKEFNDRLNGSGIGPRMIELPAGSFEMGSSGLSVAADERPRRTVTFSSFAISKFEITFAEYERFANATGRKRPNRGSLDKKTHPVFSVSWAEADAYTKWLSRKTGHDYRLPSEAEWEYAAAAGTATPYWWGRDTGSNRAHCFDCTPGTPARQPMPIGRFPANPFGLHDTAGNVLEWVGDCYHSNYTDAPTDGSVWSGGDCNYRVARGGAYRSPMSSIRTTKRAKFRASGSYDTVGFRVVRTP